MKSSPRLFLFLYLLSSSGAFQVHVVKPGENKEIYSKFQTKAFPDPQQLAESVNTFIKNGEIDFSGHFFLLHFPESFVCYVDRRGHACSGRRGRLLHRLAQCFGW
jgi:hypothetical protein